METFLSLVLFMFNAANWTFCLWAKKKKTTNYQKLLQPEINLSG